MEGEEEDEELWLLKRPINICQFVTSPFFEGEAELQNSEEVTWQFPDDSKDPTRKNHTEPA